MMTDASPSSPSETPATRTPAPPTTARGLLIVMTGASGVGKGTLREQWLKDQNVFYSTSWTTRGPREGEQDGREYHFVSTQQFLEKAAQNGFLEHAQFVGNHYGTPAEPIEAALARGQDVVLEIEVEGAMQVRERMGDQAILVFIMPPSLTELRRRLEGRATETPERIEKRLARAREEIREAHQFRYVVVNDDLEKATDQMLAMQRAERAAQKSPADRTPHDEAALQAVHDIRSEHYSIQALEDIVNS